MKKLFLSLFLLLPMMSVAQDTDVKSDSVQTSIPELVVVSNPEFPGGQAAMYKFIQDNLQYPKDARKKRIEGRTICQFAVEEDGTLTDIIIFRSAGHPSLDEEALRVIQSMPKWIPGTKEGKYVRAKYVVPIKFKL